nr:beta-1,3-galactosyltransferase 5-like [Lytechinus pictus]
MAIRQGIKRRIVGLMAVTIPSLITVYLAFQRHSSVFSRTGRDRQRIDHRAITDHPLHNCSCYMNYIRSHGGSIGGPELEVDDKSSVKTNSTQFLTPKPSNENVATPAIESPKNYLQEPIDKHLFNYIHNPERTCFHENGTEMDVFLVFFVLSAPSNFEQRDAIRRSYGMRDTWPSTGGGQVVTVFLLASTSKPELQEKIDTESTNHGDIVQETFVDSYLNLTRKTIMGLKWVKNHCRHAKFVMKIDDDTSVIQPRLLTILRNANHTNYTLGHVFKEPIVMRNKKNKFYLSKEYYPDNHFPSYPVGHGYVMTTDVVDAAFNVAVTIPLFPWEDVFFGTCLQKLNIQLNHDTDFFFWGKYTALLTGNVKTISSKHVIATDIPPKDMVRFYQRFVMT